MTTGELLRVVIALAVGVLLGSVLPADLLARRQGVDIRSIGDGNPGTVNAIRGLGLAAGLITAAYDVSVGVLAIQIAHLLGVSEGTAYVAGIATVVGHRFPVFRGLKGGGQGMAASAGLLVYGIVVAVSGGSLTIVDVVAFVAIALVTFALTRSDRMAAVVMLPILVIRVITSHADWQLTALVVTVALHIWVVQLAHLRRWIPIRRARPQTRN